MIRMSSALIFSMVGVLVLTAVVVLAVVVKSLRTRKLSGAAKARVEKAWAHVESLQDPVRKVLEADKVLDMALTEAGFSGSLGDKLKKAGSRFSNVNAVWNAHKLRNHLAHQSGAQVNVSEASAALATFRRAINEL